MTSYAQALLLFGLVVAVGLSGLAGVIIAALGLVWEVYATNATR